MNRRRGIWSIELEQKSPIWPQRVSTGHQLAQDCLVPRGFEASTILEQLILIHGRLAEFNALESLPT